MLTLKVTSIGGSIGVVLPEEALARLQVQEGDTLFLVEISDNDYRLTSCDPGFERQRGLAEEIMQEDWNMLRELAK